MTEIPDGVSGELLDHVVGKVEKNRRKMAWVSLVSLILMSGAMLALISAGLLTNDTLGAMKNLIDWIFIVLGGIPGLYVTAKAFENILQWRMKP